MGNKRVMANKYKKLKTGDYIRLIDLLLPLRFELERVQDEEGAKSTGIALERAAERVKKAIDTIVEDKEVQSDGQKWGIVK